jgi:hypothetical protein
VIFQGGLGSCSKEAVFSPNYAKNVFFYTVYNLILGLLALVKSLDLSALSQSCEEIIGFVMSAGLSVRLSAWNKSVPTGQILMKFDISVFAENLEKI